MAGKRTKAKRTAGRPTNSITVQADPIHAVKPCCRVCGSSRLKRSRVVADREHYARQAGGAATHRRRWQRAMCRDCGQWQVIVEDYNVAPEPEPGLGGKEKRNHDS